MIVKRLQILYLTEEIKEQQLFGIYNNLILIRRIFWKRKILELFDELKKKL